MADWYEDDEFWEQLSPLLFEESFAGSASQQVDDLVRLLELDEGAQVLDLCCGPGRHALELARRGFRVVGVDRTASYLENARRRAEEAGLQVEFVREDVRAFRRPGSFDAAINLFSSFGYFEDRRDELRVVENMHASLRPGGRVLLEMMGKEIVARIYQEKGWREVKPGAVLLEERKIVSGWEWMETRWIYLEGSERKEFAVRLRLYSGAELAGLLRQAGFHSVAIYGGLDGSRYDQTARRLAVVGRK